MRTSEHLDNVAHDDWVLARTLTVGQVVADGTVTDIVRIDPQTILLRFDSRRTMTVHPKDRISL